MSSYSPVIWLCISLPASHSLLTVDTVPYEKELRKNVLRGSDDSIDAKLASADSLTTAPKTGNSCRGFSFWAF